MTATPSWFHGALLPVCGVPVLVVSVRAWVLESPYESQLFAFAFASRFQRHVVLMCQDARGVPTFFGARDHVNALCRLPVEVIPWQRYAYRLSSSQRPGPPPPTPPDIPRTRYMLPIPSDPPPTLDPRNASAIGHTLDDPP